MRSRYQRIPRINLRGVILLLTHVGIPRSQSSFCSLSGAKAASSQTPLAPVLFFTAAWLVIILVLLTGIGVLWLRSAAKAALPVLDGDIHLASQVAAALSAPVTVRRDAHGVPHIEAATQDDLFVAQGYVTAQDRLWQMDAYRRNANGELAEVMGPSLVRNDKAQRVFQFRNTARRIYANLSAADRARFDAYARGVNLFIASTRTRCRPSSACCTTVPSRGPASTRSASA